MIEHISGTKYHCTVCGEYFHSSEIMKHKNCVPKEEKKVEVKPATIKVSVKAKKSK